MDYGENQYEESLESLIDLLKLISFIFLLLVFFLEVEFGIFFILLYIIGNTIATSIIFIFLQFLALHYIIECFIFMLQFPLIGRLTINSVGKVHASDLLETMNGFVDDCYKTLEKNIISYKEGIPNFSDYFEEVKFWSNLFSNMKSKGQITKYQEKLLNFLNIWMKHFQQYNLHKFINKISLYNKKEINITFHKQIDQMILDSNFIKNFCNEFLSDNYQKFSIRFLRNLFFNDTFNSVFYFKNHFFRSFNENCHSFVTSDNKIIDYCLVSSDKALEFFKNDEEYIYKKENNDKDLNTMSTTVQRSTSVSTHKNSVIKNNDKQKIKKKNLLIYCSPNGMIYEFSNPDKFLMFFEGNVDVLFWNYRGYGLSTGYSNFRNAQSDVCELYDEIIKRKNKWDKIGVLGYSIGGLSATYLASMRHVDVLISDRNFSGISDIARGFDTMGTFLYYLSKLIFLNRANTTKNYLFTKNENCFKIIFNDPNDEVIPNNGSIKNSVSKYLILNSITDDYDVNQKFENILDYILDKKEKHKLVDSFIYICDLYSETYNNSDLVLEDNEEVNDKFQFKLFKALENNPLVKSKYSHLQQNLSELTSQTLNIFFDCFNNTTDSLLNLKTLNNKTSQRILVDNFFNNLFVWGTKNYEQNDRYFMKEFTPKNNNVYLESAINVLNSFIEEKTMCSLITKEKIKVEIYENLKIIRDCLVKFKNISSKIKINENIKKGYLIKLECGHNGNYSPSDGNILLNLLEDYNFIY